MPNQHSTIAPKENAGTSARSWRSNRICFTLNNYTPTEEANLTASLNSFGKEVVYAIVGKEVGKNGTPHLQGFIHLAPSLLKACKGGILTWKSMIPSLQRAHLARAFGLDDHSKTYCQKDGNLLLEIGKPKEPVDVFTSILECQDFEEAKKIAPEICVKNYNQVQQICQRNSRNSTSPKLPGLLSSWQRAVATSLLEQDRRKITFVVDEAGNSGKSVLAQALRAHFGSEVFYCRGGKSSDIVHAFSKNRRYSIAIFDYARNKSPDYFAWDLFEEFKDGGITSLKYDGDCFWMDHPIRVLVLTNHPLDDHRGRLTQDRWDIHVLTDRTDKTPVHETIGCFEQRPQEDILSVALNEVLGMTEEEMNEIANNFEMNLFNM